MSSEDRAVEYLTPLEEDKVSRQLLIWLNTFPDIPVDVASIQYENLDADKPGMALSTIQGTYIQAHLPPQARPQYGHPFESG